MKKENDTKQRRKWAPYPESTRLQVVAEYLRGKGPKELAMKYKLSDPTLVTLWVRNFGAEPHKVTTMVKAKATKTERELLLEKELQVLQNELKRQQNELSEKQKALEREALKNEGLNLMIDLAEKSLNIPIRKKSGTKQ